MAQDLFNGPFSFRVRMVGFGFCQILKKGLNLFLLLAQDVEDLVVLDQLNISVVEGREVRKLGAWNLRHLRKSVCMDPVNV